MIGEQINLMTLRAERLGEEAHRHRSASLLIERLWCDDENSHRDNPLRRSVEVSAAAREVIWQRKAEMLRSGRLEGGRIARNPHTGASALLSYEYWITHARLASCSGIGAEAMAWQA